MTKTVVLLKPWGMHSKGAILTLAPPVADLLIQTKRAELSQPKRKPKLQNWVKQGE